MSKKVHGDDNWSDPNDARSRHAGGEEAWKELNRLNTREAAFAEVDAMAERERGRLMPTLPLRVSFRQVLLLILADGKERAESEVLSYFAPEDHGGAASTLVKLADEGEVVRREESNGVKRVKRTAVRR